MILIVKVKDTDNIIGLKEEIVSRIEDIADVERVDVVEEHSSSGVFVNRKSRSDYNRYEVPI